MQGVGAHMDNAQSRSEPRQLAELVAKLADALEAENVRCKISLWQKDESGYGFGPLGDPCPINLTHLAEFCVGVLIDGDGFCEHGIPGGVGCSECEGQIDGEELAK